MQQTKLDFLMRDYREYRDVMTPQQMAKHESDMWEALDPADRPRYDDARHRRGISEWLHKKFGGSRFDYEQRYYLYLADAADPLWRRLADKRLTLSKAVQLHRDAKKLAHKEDITIMAALAIVINDYELLPILRYENGVPIRGRRPSQLRRPKAPSTKKKKKKADPATVEVATRNFYAQLREGLGAYAGQWLTDIDPSEVERLTQALETDVRQILDDWSARVRRARVNAQRRKQQDDEVAAIQQTISRRKFTEACRTLNIAATPPGERVDLVAAKRAKHKLVRVYHPDLSGGDDSTRAAYEAVVEAYRTIEEYADYIEATIEATLANP